MHRLRSLSILTGTVLLSLSLNLLLDASNCFLGSCLTKQSAYREVRLGMSSAELGDLMSRAGVYGNSLGGGDCDVVMFSDFWRDYLIQKDPKTHDVMRKKFRFRPHGQGLFRFLH